MNVVSVVRRQPHHRAADFIGFANAFVRNQFQKIIVSFLGAPGFVVDRGANRTRTNRIDANAIRRHFLCNAFHHQHDAALTGGIVDMPRPGNDFMH